MYASCVGVTNANLFLWFTNNNRKSEASQWQKHTHNFGKAQLADGADCGPSFTALHAYKYPFNICLT